MTPGVEPAASPPAELPAELPPVPPADEADVEAEKRTVLLDLQRLERQGVTLTKRWTTDDSLDDLTLELRRHVLALDERSNVNMMRDGLRMLCTGLEMVSTRYGLLDLEGWSGEVAQTLSRHDPQLAKIYRKYWRRSTARAPEVEIALAVVGSAGMHHMKRSMAKHMLSGRGGRRDFFGREPRRPPTPDTSDDEEPPARR
jgi:hypothetical protein